MPRRLAALALLAATASVAAAQPHGKPPRPKPLPTFAQPVAFQACATSWAFACNIPTGDGHRYGTAVPHQQCTRYAFAPDGTVAISDGLLTNRGRYYLIAGQVRIELAADDGPARRFDLPLSPDGQTLGALTRLP